MRAAAVMVAVLALLVPIVAVWVRTDPDQVVRP